MKLRRLAPIALTLALAVGAPPLHAQSSLRMTQFVDLGVPVGGLGSFAYAINSFGQIAGDAYTAQGDGRAFVFEDSMRLLGPVSGYSSSGSSAGSSGINAAGHIAGLVYAPSPLGSARYSQAAVFRNGAVTLLGTLDDRVSSESFARAINDQGHVVGGSTRGIDPTTLLQTPFRAFLSAGGGMFDLGTLGGNASLANSINNHGQIVGWAQNANGVVRAFLYANGTMSDLGGPGGNVASFANAINDAGQIVGMSSRQAFLYSEGVMHSLGAVGESFSEALGLNGLGQVVGHFRRQANLPASAFIYSGGERHTLDRLASSFLASAQGAGFLSLSAAYGINDAGQVVGEGRFRDANGDLYTRAFAAVVKRLTFIWQGAEGFDFNHAQNWSDQFKPEAQDTVLLSELGAKRIVLAPGDHVQTDRLLALGGSDTTMDLNGSLWQVGADPAATDALGRFRITGGLVAVGNGVLEVFDHINLRNDGFANSELRIGAGGRVIARGDAAVSVAATGGLFESAVSVTGSQASLESFSLLVGDRGTGALRVEQGGSVFVGQNLYIGVDGVGRGLVSGAGSVIEMARGGGVGDPAAARSSALRQDLGAPTFGELRIGMRQEGRLTVENGGALRLNDALVMIGDAGVPGTLTVSGAGSMAQGGHLQVRDSGLLVVQRRGELVTGRALEILGGAVFFESGASGSVHEVFLNGGALNVDGSRVTTSKLEVFGGSVTLSNNANLVVVADQPLVSPGGPGSARIAGGVLSVEAGSFLHAPLLTLGAGARVTGRGSIVGNVINDGGTIEPGQSPGVLTIAGDYRQLGGRIVLEIAGLGVGTEHDQLRIGGDFALDGGAVELQFIGGFAPSTGERYALLDVSGGFAGAVGFTVSGLQPGWQFNTAFDAASGNLWLTSLNNGVAAPVPEPSRLWLMVAGASFLGGLRARRRAGA